MNVGRQTRFPHEPPPPRSYTRTLPPAERSPAPAATAGYVPTEKSFAGNAGVTA
jgi:hypothetical protein